MRFELEQASLRGSESRVEAIPTLAALGISEPGEIKTGLTRAPILTYTGEVPHTGDKIFATAIGYPLGGLYLHHVLDAISPKKDMNGTGLSAASDDWRMPERAALGIAEDVWLDKIHSSIPGYTTFRDQHSAAWLQALDDPRANDMYDARRATVFVDSDKAVQAKRRAFYTDLMGPEEAAQEFVTTPSTFPHEEEFEYLFQDYNSTNRFRRDLIMLDPRRGQGYKYSYLQGVSPVSFMPFGTTFDLSLNGVTAHTVLGETDDKGMYQEKSVELLYPKGYKGVTPLIAWKETRDGRRAFLTNDEVAAYVPGHVVGSSDHLLGKVSLAYLQPEIVVFPEELGLGKDGKRGKAQDIYAAQVPLMFARPEFGETFLQTPLVTDLQQILLGQAA